MTHPVTELAAAAFIIAAAVGTMFAVTPQPKPEPPPARAEATQQTLKRCQDDPQRMCVVQVEPEPVVEVRQRKVDQIAKDVKKARSDIAEIREAILLKQAVENLPSE